ncbi:MAG: geranylgeranyl reductase family protein [Gemmatimonadota bacterium]|nr:MAG: geranylgeranyl reductase family protein [Gemmatimonadota bacterium]
MERAWDVVIIGAGPAGSTAAATLAPLGHSVLLLDRHSFPREKVCGDGLIPDALTSLRSLGLYDRVKRLGHSVDHLTVVSPAGIHVEIPAECITLRREKLDTLILEHAISRGSTFVKARIERVQQEERGGVRALVAPTGELIHARVAIIATGANVELLVPLGMVVQQRANGMATRCYVRSPVEIDRLIVSFEKEAAPGYGWIFPMGGGEYNVGCGIFYDDERCAKVNLRQTFESFTAAKVARSLMTGADSITPLRGARLRAGLGGAVLFNGGSVIAIGETIGSTYPFTGEGIGKAMETAMLAAQQVHLALEQGDTEPLSLLPALVEEQLSPRYLGYRVAQRWISKPWLTDLLAARICRSPHLTRAAAGIINETTDPRTVFTWRTLLPDWMRIGRWG